MTKTMPAKPEWLAAKVSQAGRKIGVDRENKVIHGYVVAELGVFKDGRGEFTRQSLDKIVELGNSESQGLKSRLSHPNMSDDGLAKKLGRGKSLFLDESGDKLRVRGDLHLGSFAEKAPGGDLADYVMTLAEEDPDSFGSSLVLIPEQKFRRDEDGALLEDEDGNPLPPIWIPKELHASDVVDEGAASTSFLSNDAIDQLPDKHVRRVSHALDQLFNGQEPDVVRSRCLAFLDRYLGPSQGEDDMSDKTGVTKDDIKELLSEQSKSFNERVDALQTKLDEEKEARLKAETDRNEALAEERRVKEIQELGSMHKIDSEKIAEWTREKLSADEARKLILADLAGDRKLSKDSGSGDDPDHKKDPNKKYKEEYKERAKLGEMVSLTEEQYVLSRRIDDGLESLTGISEGAIPLPIEPETAEAN